MTMDRKKKTRISMLLNLAIVLLEIIGFSQGMQAEMFIYYTNISNLVTLAASAVFLISIIRVTAGGDDVSQISEKSKASEKPDQSVGTEAPGVSSAPSALAPEGLSGIAVWLKYLAVCMTTVTFLVVVCILAPMQGVQMIYSGNFLYFHLLCPILQLISFVGFDAVFLEKRQAVIGVLPTVAYAVAAIICNLLGVLTGPYPFLMVKSQPVVLSVIWFVVILGFAYLIAYMLIRCKRH